MADAGRLGDKAHCPSDSHGCPSCSHSVIGPATSGSPNVNINSRSALREGDVGVHAACCGANTWRADTGAPTVFINGKPAHRRGDATRHCGGMGKLIEGSPNVNIGDTKSNATAEPGKLKLDFRIILPTGKPLPNEPFDVLDYDGNIITSGVTDDDGRATIEDVPHLTYFVHCKSGFILSGRR